ncbi:POK9 protein, partial [Syrrhaptes paradoxus]|nr:POK9 protein [Syrrhaptes paradoxus]
PTGVHGPVQYNGQPCGALLLGRSSSGLKGLFIIPGVIDADFYGEIHVVVQTLFPPMVIPAGSVIAQLVPMQQLTDSASAVNKSERGSAGFGSTGGLALLSLTMGERPTTTVILQNGSNQLSV